MSRILVKIAEGHTLVLPPGGQNELVSQVLQEFATRFSPGGRVIYVGGTNEKCAYFDKGALKQIGVSLDPHEHIPNVIIHHKEKDWLILIEAVTSHGPINMQRKRELERLFRGSRAGLVFVTAFVTRQAMAKYLTQISWGTNVWMADSPAHLIHLKGEKLSGPYSNHQPNTGQGR
jgi:hypothetical protein